MVVGAEQDKVVQVRLAAVDPRDDVVSLAPFRWVVHAGKAQPPSRTIRAANCPALARRRVRPDVEDAAPAVVDQPLQCAPWSAIRIAWSTRMGWP